MKVTLTKRQYNVLKLLYNGRRAPDGTIATDGWYVRPNTKLSIRDIKIWVDSEDLYYNNKKVYATLSQLVQKKLVTKIVGAGMLNNGLIWYRSKDDLKTRIIVSRLLKNSKYDILKE